MDEEYYRYDLPRPVVTQPPRIPRIMRGKDAGKYQLNRRLIGVGQYTGLGKLPTGNNTYALLYYMRGGNVTIRARGWIESFQLSFVAETSLRYYEWLQMNNDPQYTAAQWFSRTVDRNLALEVLSPYARTERDRDHFLHDLGTLMGYEIIDIDQLEVIPGRGGDFA